MTYVIEAHAGEHIREILQRAVEMAVETRHDVEFDFNGRKVTVQAGGSYETAKARAEETLGSPILTAEEAAEHARKSLEEMQTRNEAAIAEAGALTEAEMRDAKVPWPKTPEELSAYIAGLVDRPHDYGTCVYAISMAAVAAFHYVSGQLGVTGFQASCADMDILRRTRSLELGFRVVDYSGVLYPQYWKPEVVPIFCAALRDNPERFLKAARELLAKGGGVEAVRQHWKWLAAGAPGAAETDSAEVS